jgi:hypothetical protein
MAAAMHGTVLGKVGERDFTSKPARKAQFCLNSHIVHHGPLFWIIALLPARQQSSR